jgi:hypothetical protein
MYCGTYISTPTTDPPFYAYSLIGVIVRKQTFVTAYAVGLYVHFLLNLGVAGYLFSVILHATREDTNVLCQHAINNSQGQSQCSTVFNAIRGAYAALASAILIIELCESPTPRDNPILIGLDGAIVATRYVYQVRGEKREARKPRHMRGDSAGGGQFVPGFVRFDDVASGTRLYSMCYDPLAQGHARASSAYSFASADFEGATPMGLYDPPTKGLVDSKHHADLVLEDGYKESEQEGYGFKDLGYDHVADPPPYGVEKIP